MVLTKRKITLCFYFLVVWTIGMWSVGCKSSKPAPEQPVEQQPATATAAVPAVDEEYQQIVAQAANLDGVYQTLQTKAQEYLQKRLPDNEIERQQCMTVAVIACGCCYWEGNTSQATQLATQAYSYGPVKFLPEWDAQSLVKSKPYPIAQKFSQMKDFILAAASQGLADFSKGNEMFLSEAQFSDAIPLYQAALSKGLENAKARRECHLRLSACLFKAGNQTDAEKVFLETWLVDPKLELSFGDEATREFLVGLGEKSQAEFVK